MVKTKESYKIKKHPIGFYQLDPLPSTEELKEFYADKYYQQCTSGSYAPSYNDAELEYITKKNSVVERIWQSFSNGAKGSIIDIGCGEGFLAAYFLKKEWKIKALDFSSFAVEKFNKELLPYFIQGDVYESLERIIADGEKFDFINLGCILEHVLDPQLLLNMIKKIMHKKSLLNIIVPNDYSALQLELIEKKHLDKEYWFCPLDHINYFDFDSLEKFLRHLNFSIFKKQANFPTEIFTANADTNYYKDSTKGKQVHYARVFVETFLMNQGLDKYIEYMEASANIGFSRACAIYVTLEQE